MNYQCKLNICSVFSYEECMAHRSCLNRQSGHCTCSPYIGRHHFKDSILLLY